MKQKMPKTNHVTRTLLGIKVLFYSIFLYSSLYSTPYSSSKNNNSAIYVLYLKRMDIHRGPDRLHRGGDTPECNGHLLLDPLHLQHIRQGLVVVVGDRLYSRGVTTECNGHLLLDPLHLQHIRQGIVVGVINSLMHHSLVF